MRHRPRALFRVDSGLVIGSGHLMRCLTLADALASQGIDSMFACRDHEGNLNALVERRGHTLCKLPVDEVSFVDSQYGGWRGASIQDEIQDLRILLSSMATQLLVIDHYGLDADVEAPLTCFCETVLVIDDLHDRRHECHVLIDHNIGRCASAYVDLVRPKTQILVGPDFCLLNPVYSALRKVALKRRARQVAPKRLLVAVGGGDRCDISGQVLEGLASATRPAWIEGVDVVLTSNSPHLPRISSLCERLPEAILHVDLPELSRLIAAADVAIGACGVTAMERCALGLPSIVVILADNQIAAARHLSEAGAVLNLGDARATTWIKMAAALQSFADKTQRDSMALAAAELCDGAGVARVIEKLRGVLPMH